MKGLSLDIADGEFVAIMGESGSGKSTLLHLLGGLDRPDTGRLTCAGFELAAMDAAALAFYRRTVTGLIFQNFNLLPALTLRDNVVLPIQLRGEKPDTKLIAELLEAAGIEKLAGRLPEQLSGGEQQRCAIVRALAARPRLLLADEPTGSLDRRTGERILLLLCDLARTTGTTVVMVTHSSRAAGVADRIVEIEDGRIRAPLP